MAFGDADKAKPKGDPGLLIALGGPEKPGASGAPSGDPEAPAMDEVKAMASDDAMAAMKSGDSAAFQDAMTRFVKACKSEDY